MTPLESLVHKSHNPQGWSLVLNEECLAVVNQVDSLEDTIDSVYIFLKKLDLYLPTDSYPNTLVQNALKMIDKYWEEFTPKDYV